ncbi:uncharacterized protein LOC112538932 [Tetranychus urticae]|uniref:uncharacterized protein LOC112538932 n=1 Tax=Tetranychus urticae TaxID=32264 RepID=UPI000D6459C9|nr:uncharacterized protein LOC112538932 [Tetranychus urticae]
MNQSNSQLTQQEAAPVVAAAPVVTTGPALPLPNISLTINYFSGDDDENIIDWFQTFEFSAKALGWSETDMFNAIPAYLQGTARRWYYAISGQVMPEHVPTNYIDLKNRMVEDLCPADYRSYLSQELYKATQKIGQSAVAFIYEMNELCLRIHEKTPEVFIVSMIKEKLLPQIKYGIALHNPKTLQELVERARLAERAMHSCANPFEPPNREIIQLQTQVQQIKERMETFTRRCTICKRLGHTEDRCHYANRNPVEPNPNYNTNQSNQTHPIGVQPYSVINYGHPTIMNDPNYQQVIAQANNNYQAALASGNYQPGRPAVTNRAFAERKPPQKENETENWRDRPSTSKKETEVKTAEAPKQTRRGRSRERSATPKRGRPPSRGRGRGRGKAPQVRVMAYQDEETEEEPVSDYEYEPDDQYIVNPVVFILHKNLIQQFVKVNGVKVDSMLDTGSEISLITKELADNLNLKVKNYDGPVPYAANNKPLPILGKVKVQMKITDGSKVAVIDTKLQVVKKLPRKFKVLVGQDLLSEAKININCGDKTIKIGTEKHVELITTDDESSLQSPEEQSHLESEQSHEIYDLNDFVSSDSGIIQSSDCPESESENHPLSSIVDRELPLNIESGMPGGVEKELVKLCNEYRTAFAVSAQELVRTNLFQHKIETGNHPPIAQSPYSQSEQKREITKQTVAELLRDGIIVDSFSPWCSPVVLVSKKTGDWRMCVDYRKLNAITVKDSYPIPNINVSLDALKGSQYFSLLDLRSGYHQVELAKEDRQKSAFVTSFGMYEYVTMPFGLCNAPATFQRLMNCCLSGLKYSCCLVYIDDIIVFSKTIEEHFVRLKAVFNRLRAAGLTLKPDKCFFFKRKILYLGHIISYAGQEPDPEKIRAVKNFPIPLTLRDIRAFVALCSYYRKFIKDFAKIAQPLTQLTKKETPFVWGQDQMEAFEYLKACLIRAPVLAHYDHTLETQLRTDASDVGLGAILLQKHDGKWKPVAFASRQIRGAEINYPISDKECLAIIYAFEKFRHYLEGIKFEIVTDHCALCFMRSKTKLPPRLMRYAMTLQSFEFTITYKSGKIHKDADCLSRYPTNDPEFNSIGEDDKEQGDDIFALLISEQEDESINLMNQQRDDPLIQAQIQQLNDIEKLEPRIRNKIIRNHRLQDGILQRKVVTETGTNWVPVVPASLIKTILQSYHNDVVSGHCGLYQTYAKLKPKYYWPKMSRDIANYIKTCEECQRNKKGTGNAVPPLKPIYVSAPFEKIGIDILGPLPPSAGKEYIIVATDYFTRWVEMKAIAKKDTINTAKFLIENILCRHGCPKTIVSDQGRNFIADTIKEIALFMNTKWQLSTTYHPQTNGMTERVNRTICEMLSHYCQETNRLRWSQILPLMNFAYNTSTNQSTQFSPFYLLYGREPTLPIDLKINPDNRELRLSDYVEFIHNEWTTVKEQARMNSDESKEKQSKNYERRRRLRTFSIGDLVLYEKQVRSNKLDSKYEGPYEIIEKIGETTYLVRKDEHSEPKRVHGSQIKPYSTISRTSRSQNNLILSKSVILMILTLLISIANPFEFGEPLIWKDSTNKFLKGIIAVNQTIMMVNPCKSIPEYKSYFDKRIGMMSLNESDCTFVWQIDNLTKTYRGCVDGIKGFKRPVCDAMVDQLCFQYTHRNDIFYIARQSCLKYINEKMNKVKELCTSMETRSNGRQRRDFGVSAALFGASLVVLGTNVLYNNFGSAPTEAEEITNKFMEQTSKILVAYQAKLMEMSATLSDLKIRVAQLENTTLENSFKAADISYEMNRLISTMQETMKFIISQGTIPKSTFDFFNLTLPCGASCPLEDVTDAKCQFLGESNETWYMSLTFKVKELETNLVVQKADAFTLLTKEGNSICLRRYKGPQYIVVNTSSTEICQIDPEEVKQRFLVHYPNYCDRTLNISIWSNENCVENSKYKIRKPQVKMINDHFYIYCVGHNITLFGNTKTCPDKILKIAMTLNFSIDDTPYTVTQLAHLEKYTMTSMSNLINWKLLDIQPALQNDTLSHDIEILQNLVKEHKGAIASNSWVEWIKKSLITLSLAIITLCFVLLILTKFISTICYCIRRPVVSVNILPDQNNRTQKVIPLSSLY